MFDEYQNNAIFSNEDKVLLVAAPGSGKTTVIIEKLMYLVSSGFKEDSILLITFTKKACENMRERFDKLSKSSTSPHFYTFHALFYKIIRDNINSNFEIITDENIQKFLSDILKNYIDFVSEYKIQSFMCEIIRFNASNQSIDEFETRLPKHILKDAIERYKSYKLFNNLYDFDDLEREVLRLFKDRNDILEFYRDKFKYILVDEFQDCNNVQFEILKMLSIKSKLFCVGDDDQSIYKFRGANPSIMVSFCDVFEGAKKYYLKYNYRSKHSIINFSRNVIENNRIRNKKQLCGNKKEEGEVICKKFLEDTDQGKYIVDDIENLQKSGVNLCDFAVLYRNHKDSFSILSEFIKRNIKINFLDSDFNIFEIFYIKDIINFLKFIDNPTINNFKEIYNKVTFLFSRRVNQIINKFDYDSNFFSVIDANFDKISCNDKRSIFSLKKMIKRFRKYPIDSRINGILNKLGYSLYLDNIITQKKLNKAEVNYFIEYFYNVITKFKSVDEFSKNIRLINSTHGVNFGTIHSSKGMEFRCVYIINARDMDREMNFKNNINIFYDEEEERRIFYVGITRAIDSLKILSPYFIEGRFNNRLSRFIGEGLMDSDYGNIDTCNIKKISKNKVLLYVDGKRKSLDTKDYLEIT
ncbi:ATP-dependent helicase [Candidatus Arthromitus sp. SFB-rat-Yit]|uniref:ATP-dependent helicase n=1 Tax=Candidatus Arthromitus sp. SFB-rat-Yit TaxID=1041504 RepID=UPI000227A560|nr:ATP-dependent helicase [Candidatus Arthromitus sp. SFB-rat-Yit]BAK81012.1 helicase, UvrD/REP family [Candidatus Arthromitus sp. SFB-rat-Yit]